MGKKIKICKHFMSSSIENNPEAKRKMDRSIDIDYLASVAREHPSVLNWRLISNNAQKLTISFIKEFSDYLDWYIISSFNDMRYIEHFPERICFITFSKSLFTDEVIDKYKDRIDWDQISRRMNLSIDLIRKYKDYLDWSVVSARQRMPQDFIDEMKDYIDWKEIFRSKKLSEKFIISHIDYIDIDTIARLRWYGYYSKELIDKLENLKNKTGEEN